MAVNQDVARQVEVIVGSAWAVYWEQKWHRVRVEGVDDSTVNVRNLDYGHVLQQPLEVHHLHRLPPGIATSKIKQNLLLTARSYSLRLAKKVHKKSWTL